MSMIVQYISQYSCRLRPVLAAAFGGLFLAAAGLPESALAQDDPCSGLLFSTSEDFLTRGPKPADGNPIISDGDLLAWHVSSGARICRRNADLIRRFDISRVDLGLDAVASVDEKRELIAFSTELDSPNGDQFTAGDLLFTNGGIIPNAALLARFKLPRSLDLGLDAVTLIGKEDRLRRFAELARTGRLRDNPDQLAGILKELDIDIWFSTEGTPPEIGKPMFLDGDLLSARDGVIVRSNASLLPALPAGIPVRGADYGLDAFTPALDPIENVPVELMSTEIVGFGPTPFTDGDVLQPGPSIWLKAGDLLKTLEPATRDLGLDALHDTVGDVVQCAPPSITFISNVEVGVIDLTTGLADFSGVTQRPFANDIRIQGSMPEVVNCPELAKYEYRVEIDQGAGFPAFADPGVVHPASDNWRRMVRPTPASPCPISRNDVYDSDPLGWFAVTDYRRFDGCGDPPSLAVWDSTTGASNALVRVRLVMREIGATTPTYVSGAVRVQIDNDRISLPDNLLQTSSGTGDMWFDIYRASATSPLGDQCKVEGDGKPVVLDMKGRINDDHFWKYDLRWSGGFVVGAHMITTAADQPEFDDGRADLDGTGTQPPNSILVPLKTGFDLTAAYASVAAAQSVPTELPDVCGFTVHFRAWDRAIQLNFAPAANYFGPVSRHTTMWRSFCVSR
ncbi:hypothetical protein SAMN05444414_11352 [Roseovarius marisflavi]|uniref:Uncharacterized protein n=1 Tax=Roseovarius marisflavi TaxID=1054996 RepID=A0A1M7AES9_9RHOB|nr:hypothetical protein SAMN05444414_11352 [Roseovarius marisflavi]